MDLAGIISEISFAITGEKTSGARLENKEGTWKIFIQDGETVSLTTDEKGFLVDIVTSSGDAPEVSEKERLEIEKLKLDIQVQKKVLENLEKKDQKESKIEPALPKLIILAYTGGGISGKSDEATVTDGRLTQRGPNSKGAPIYNIPDEDREELLKLSGALVFGGNVKLVYGERLPDVFFSNYTVSFVGKRELTVTWYKDGTKVPVELEKFDAKYREIYARSKPVK